MRRNNTEIIWRNIGKLQLAVTTMLMKQTLLQEMIVREAYQEHYDSVMWNNVLETIVAGLLEIKPLESLPEVLCNMLFNFF